MLASQSIRVDAPPISVQGEMAFSTIKVRHIRAKNSMQACPRAISPQSEAVMETGRAATC
jgi:hypothetical protein